MYPGNYLCWICGHPAAADSCVMLRCRHVVCMAVSSLLDDILAERSADLWGTCLAFAVICGTHYFPGYTSGSFLRRVNQPLILCEAENVQYCAPDGGAEYCDEPVCLCVFVCLRSYLRNDTSDLHLIFVHVTYGCSSVLLWRRSDMLPISAFVNDVIFAHRLIGCSTSPPGWGSEAHTYAALGLARRNTRCRQRTLGTTSCSQSLLGRSGRVEYLWHRACTWCPCI